MNAFKSPLGPELCLREGLFSKLVDLALKDPRYFAQAIAAMNCISEISLTDQPGLAEFFPSEVEAIARLFNSFSGSFPEQISGMVDELMDLSYHINN